MFSCDFYTNFENTYFMQHLQMTPSETMHESKRIMRGLHKLFLSTNKTAFWNRMYFGGKKLCSVLSNFCFKGKESNLIWIIQWNLLTFRRDAGCAPSSPWSWHVKKDIIYARILHHGITGSCIMKHPSPVFL